MEGIAIAVLAVLLTAAAVLLAIVLARARQSARRFEVLHRIADVSDRCSSLRETLDEVCEVIVPEVADI